MKMSMISRKMEDMNQVRIYQYQHNMMIYEVSSDMKELAAT